MDAGLYLAVGLALAFALTNGFHDASNSIASVVATRAASPARALALASLFNMLGPLLLGAAVANTIAGIAAVPARDMVAVVGSALVAAAGWNLATWWRGLPSSSGHALVGGLVGSALAEGGAAAVNWGGFDGWRPVGVLGTLVALAVSPLIGAIVAFAAIRLLQRLARKATVRFRGAADAGQWVGSAALAMSHGANDAQKTIGVVAALLLATDRTQTLSTPLALKVACAAALTLGTALGGWRIVKTIGRRIYRIRSLDGLASQGASTGVILGASFLGAPISTTHVVASSIVGIGTGRNRWQHVRWTIVEEMGIAWLTTIPATAILAAVSYACWQWIA